MINLLPYPQKLTFRGRWFYPEWRYCFIICPAKCEHFLLNRLVDELNCTPSMQVKEKSDSGKGYLLYFSRKKESLVPRIREDKIKPGGYDIEVNPSFLLLHACDRAGFFAGIQTLRQLAVEENRKKKLPVLTIQDWPTFPLRGVLLDISRGQVPRVRTIKNLISTLSFYRMNVLSLYIEHTFFFEKHPVIGKDSGALTKRQVKEIDSYAKKHGIELIPSFQSFGHFYRILKHPQYEHLTENSQKNMLSPVNPDSYKFLEELYSEIVPAFSSPFFNVCCDETVALGKGKSRKKAEKIGRGEVYLEHILFLYKLLKRYGKKMILWGDMLFEFPEICNRIPEDVVVFNWDYDDHYFYPRISFFNNSGLNQVICPGTNSWLRLFPDLRIARGNITNSARQGLKEGASGLVVCDWADGQVHNADLSWYPFLWSAETGWRGTGFKKKDFNRRFSESFFGYNTENLMQAIELLSQSNRILSGEFRDFRWGKSLNMDAFFVSPFSSTFSEPLFFSKISGVKEKGDKLKEIGKSALLFIKKDRAKVIRNKEKLASLEFTARQVQFLGEKIVLTGELIENYYRFYAQPEIGRGYLSKCIIILKELKREFEKLKLGASYLFLRDNKKEGIAQIESAYGGVIDILKNRERLLEAVLHEKAKPPFPDEFFRRD
jgi:hypothetical protein